MTHFKVDDLRDGYVTICRYVAEHGAEVSPRGMKTRELLDVVIELSDPRDALPVGVNRQLNRGVAAVEALQLVSGTSFPDLTCRIASNFERFRNGGTFHGAYGQRTRGQVARAIQRLVDDPDTRQAVVTVWDPQHDLYVDGQADYPCTLSLDFLIRDGKLQLHTTMRSNDVWLGLAYDAFQFTQLQIAVANAIGIPAGPYFHHAVSLHAYERDFDKIALLTNFAYDAVMLNYGSGVGDVRDDPETSPLEWWSDAQQLALGWLDGTVPPAEDDEAGAWYWNALLRGRLVEQTKLIP